MEVGSSFLRTECMYVDVNMHMGSVHILALAGFRSSLKALRGCTTLDPAGLLVGKTGLDTVSQYI